MGASGQEAPEGGMMKKDIHKRHGELVKQMMKDKRFDAHHEMSEKLQKAKTMQEFDAILDEYDLSKAV